MPEDLTPNGNESVQTHRLDDVVELDEIDFIKLDVQGAELSVLKGATRIAQSALIIQTEVELVPLYKDQPLFADIDLHIRGIGFQFHTFLGFGTRPYQSLKKQIFKGGFRQIIWSDAVYVPDILHLDSYSDVRLLKLSALLHDLYRSVDLALAVLRVLEKRGQTEPFQIYAKELGLS